MSVYNNIINNKNTETEKKEHRSQQLRAKLFLINKYGRGGTDRWTQDNSVESIPG